MKKILAYLLFALLWLLSLLPLWALYLLISDVFFLLTFYVIGYRKKVVFTNLKNAFPEKNEAERKKIARKFYRHFCDTFAEGIKITTMPKKQLIRRIAAINNEILDKYYQQNRPIVLVLGHYGNWEWMTGHGLTTKYIIMAVYKPLKNKTMDFLMLNTRQRFQAVLVPMRKTYKAFFEQVGEKKLTMLALLADQNPGRNKKNVHQTTFLNQDTTVFIGPEKIAKKTNSVVLFLKLKKIKRGHYQTEWVPITETPNETKPYEITETHVRLLENIIREQPEYWLWSHRRWKHKTMDTLQ